MDYLTLFLVASPVFTAMILVLLLVHVMLSERHNKRIEKLTQQVIEQLNYKQIMPQYTWKSTDTRKAGTPVKQHDM